LYASAQSFLHIRYPGPAVLRTFRNAFVLDIENWEIQKITAFNHCQTILAREVQNDPDLSSILLHGHEAWNLSPIRFSGQWPLLIQEPKVPVTLNPLSMAKRASEAMQGLLWVSLQPTWGYSFPGSRTCWPSVWRDKHWYSKYLPSVYTYGIGL